MNNPAQPHGPQTQPQAGSTPSASVQPTAASAPLGSAILSFDPPTLDQAVGSTFTVNVNLTGGQNVSSVPVQIPYNPRVLQVLNVSNGTMLSQDGQTVALVNRDDSMVGILQVTASRPPGATGISGDGSVFTLTFQARAPGQSTLSINRATRQERRYADHSRKRVASHRDGSLGSPSKPIGGCFEGLSVWRLPI